MSNENPSSNPNPSGSRKCPRCSRLLISRHCLDCGYSQPLPLPEGARRDSTTEEITAAHRRASRDNLLIALLAEHSITLPANAIEWRAVFLDGEHPRGEIRGLNLYVRLLLTDGVTAWFLTGSGSPFYGHFSNFVPDEPEKLVSFVRPRKPTKKAEAIAKAVLED